MLQNSYKIPKLFKIYLVIFSISLKLDPDVLTFETLPGEIVFMTWQSTMPSLRTSSYGFPLNTF